MKAQIFTYSFMILLLAAHFSRAEREILAIIVLIVPFLFFVKSRWTIQFLQGVAFFATIAWLSSAYEYVSARMASGDDWIRLLIILIALAIYSAWSGYFLLSDHVKTRYGFSTSQTTDDAETN